MKPSFVLIDRVDRRPHREARTAAGAAPAVDPPYGHRRAAARSGSAASMRVRRPNGRRLVGRAVRGKDCDCSTCRTRCCRASATISARSPPTAHAGTVAVSSPQGNCFAGDGCGDRRVVSARALTEVCGLAPDGAGFMATTGTGAIIEPDGANTGEPNTSGTTTCSGSRRRPDRRALPTRAGLGASSCLAGASACRSAVALASPLPWGFAAAFGLARAGFLRPCLLRARPAASACHARRSVALPLPRAHAPACGSIRPGCLSSPPPTVFRQFTIAKGRRYRIGNLQTSFA